MSEYFQSNLCQVFLFTYVSEYWKIQTQLRIVRKWSALLSGFADRDFPWYPTSYHFQFICPSAYTWPFRRATWHLFWLYSPAVFSYNNPCCQKMCKFLSSCHMSRKCCPEFIYLFTSGHVLFASCNTVSFDFLAIQKFCSILLRNHNEIIFTS